MNCPHLENIVVVKTLKQTQEHELCCSVCHSAESTWLCVTCGQLNCGRYVKAHGLGHFDQTKQKHSICLETRQTSVFCYLCDDFVINDNDDSRIAKLRNHLIQLQEKDLIGGDKNHHDDIAQNIVIDEEDSEVVLKSQNEVNSSSESSLKSKVSESRELRPRRKRRSKSPDRSGVENHQPPTNKKVKRQQEKKLKNLVGLRNLGNTCFMSAVLQSLSNIHEFCRVLKQLPSLEVSASASTSNNMKRDTRNHSRDLSSVVDGGAIMTEELRKVLMALSQGEAKKAISPEELFHVIWKVVPRFRGYQQQDAHEFLRYMLDRLHTELLALLPGDLAFLQKNISPYSRRHSKGLSQSSHSLVTSIFGGMLQSEVSCLVCKTSSKKHDPFLDLSIDIPNQFIQFRKNKEKEGEKSKSKCRLDDCLKKFTDVEELADSERFLCGRCNRKQPSTKKFWIRRLPNVLCLHIKRFRWSPYSRTKLDTHVDFPVKGLDMSDYLLSNLHETRCSNAGSCLYDLAAVIVHHGSGAGSGHYTAFGSKDSHWYHFNDSNVISTDTETVKNSKAYILFYIQREFRLPTPT